ncbi:MAG TPA: ATP-binding protein [Acidimicrobiales bacterium]|nr:ATP-binding protein [Acidimicrobiales bacterium]
MSDQARIRTARAMTLFGAALAIGGLMTSLATGNLAFWWRSFAGLGTMVAVAFAVFVWLVVPHQPRNAAVWSMSASFGLGIEAAGLGVLPLLMEGDPLDILESSWVPADAPAAVGWTLVVVRAASIPGLFVPLTFGLLLFPDGSFASRRWRRVGVFAAAGIVALAAMHGWWHRPSNASRAESPMLIGAGIACVFAAGLSVAGLVTKFRKCTGSARLQFKWIVWGTAIGVTVFSGFFFVPDTAHPNDLVVLGGTLAAACWVVSYGIAIGKYRLYDVDVVISRTVVFAGLALLITTIYVVVVVGLGSVFGGSDLWLSVLATALVAVVFEPVRIRFQSWANRLVYGHRATPYEVLGELTSRLAFTESAEQLLERLAVQLRSGTGAQRVTVWLDDGGVLRPVAVAPAGVDPRETAAQWDTGRACVVPIDHEGAVLGQLTVEEGPGLPLHPTDVRLAQDLAGSAALILNKVRLDRALATKAMEIDESRRRLVRAQDDELRRLERELNHGVEQQVVALKVQLGLAGSVARSEGSDRAAELIAQVGADSQDAIDQIRLLAQGIYPPLLDAEGLEAAIPSLAARSPLDVRVDVALCRRYPSALEGAVYFCVSESLTNASKYARGPVSVTVRDDDGVLAFSVTDSGPGFDAERSSRGSGMYNMADRLDALDGKLTVTSRPGAPTTIFGALPLAVASMS